MSEKKGNAYSSQKNKGPNTRTIFLNDNVRNLQYNYISNYIRTTKYTKWTYLPVCLFNQFSRVANIYFLIMAVIQSIPIISPLNPATAIAPLVLVVAVSMIREGIEDYIRYVSDKGKLVISLINSIREQQLVSLYTKRRFIQGTQIRLSGRR